MKNSTIDLTRRLDQLEQSLPPIPAKSVAFGRAAVRRTNDVVTSVTSDVARRLDRVFRTARTSSSTTTGQARAAAGEAAEVAGTSAKQAVGQARAAASRTGKAAATATRRTAGQARAEAGQVGAAADRETQALVDDATNALESDVPGSGTAYEEWTKAELYERAQELDVDGRSQMSKRELIDALRAT